MFDVMLKREGHLNSVIAL